ncbi:hypothetical protein, partial [Brucella abortus]
LPPRASPFEIATGCHSAPADHQREQRRVVCWATTAI